MKKFTFQVPIAGTIIVEVEAESREEAEEELFEDHGDTLWQERSRDLEWDVYDPIVNGSVVNAPLNKMVLVKSEKIDESKTK